ncbi:MAG TPA: hypothetical protein VES67_12345 [Vicinamibacterales bacterium]|nr:hypothetical protein [Vicinamibacterales bacterium]
MQDPTPTPVRSRHQFAVRRLVAVALACAMAAPSLVGTASQAPARELPARLGDQEFWKLSEELSEPGGTFRSDNLLSNEIGFPPVIGDLVARVKPGGVYMGVGPEQNFHYIVAIKPRMVFITDVRRGNLHLQLMYKALFELSADRSEFVSRLFTKPKQPAVDVKSSAGELMNAYFEATAGDEAAYKANLQAIYDLLEKKHGFPLSADDRTGIDYVYHNFYFFGPGITYSSSSSGQQGGRTTYHTLMTAPDASGVGRSYLASEESFLFLKDLETRNLLVPVVGNFGGPKAIRAVGKYIRDHGATVTAFYLSNVEQYLTQDGLWSTFCANVATLPLDDASTFIRSRGGMWLGPMLSEVKGCVGTGL